MPYRIRNWDKNFENNKTRLLKTMTWLPISTDLGSPGYAELVGGHPDGAAHFGFFISMLEMASRGTPRGHLSAGIRHHDATSMALMSRMSVTMIETALERLVSIGWVETWHVEGTKVPEKAPDLALVRPEQDNTGRSVGLSEDLSVGRSGDRQGGKGNGEATSDPLTGGPPSPESKAKTEERRKQAKKILGTASMERNEA